MQLHEWMAFHTIDDVHYDNQSTWLANICTYTYIIYIYHIYTHTYIIYHYNYVRICLCVFENYICKEVFDYICMTVDK